jgi:hypothetical protein
MEDKMPVLVCEKCGAAIYYNRGLAGIYITCYNCQKRIYIKKENELETDDDGWEIVE